MILRFHNWRYRDDDNKVKGYLVVVDGEVQLMLKTEKNPNGVLLVWEGECWCNEIDSYSVCGEMDGNNIVLNWEKV